MFTLLTKRLVVGALGLVVCACSNPQSAANAHRSASASTPTMQSGTPAGLGTTATQQVRFLDGTLVVDLPSDMRLQMESPPNLKSYGTQDVAVLLATAKVPHGVPADPQALLDQTEINLKRQDPQLKVLSKREIPTAGNRIVQSLSVLMNLPGKGQVFGFYAIGMKGDQIVTITQVISGRDRQRYEPTAEAIVRSLADVK